MESESYRTLEGTEENFKRKNPQLQRSHSQEEDVILKRVNQEQRSISEMYDSGRIKP